MTTTTTTTTKFLADRQLISSQLARQFALACLNSTVAANDDLPADHVARVARLNDMAADPTFWLD